MLSIALFFLGSLGNFYHHHILAKLREGHDDGPIKYVAPHGGLFNRVAAPHYFFELLAWLGVAIVSNHLNAYLVFTSMGSYLCGRSVSQNRWNREKFVEDWPDSRRNMIPGLF